MPDPSKKNAFDLKAELARLPDEPGVYRMWNAADELIYVGKALSLKKRVRNYFQKNHDASPKVRAMVENIARFDYIVTDSELEALILEANLIKEYQPKYNILLRDDKKYPWLIITDEPFPRILMVRDPLRFGKRVKAFGPYVSGAEATLQAIRKHFPLRQRRKPLFKNRPCMNYYIGACMGPCQDLVTAEEYDAVIRQLELFLKGKSDDLLSILEKEMEKASEAMQFERAARLRDRYMAVQGLAERQKVFYHDGNMSQDIVAAASDELRCAVVVMNIRSGKLIGSRAFDIALANQSTRQEAYTAFLTQYYQDLAVSELPDEILIELPLAEIPDAMLLQRLLKERRQKNVALTSPQKGVKKQMLAMAQKNAQQALEKTRLYESTRMQRDPARALMELQEALNLPDFPERMECYDISHVQGSNTVASMVVFTNGVPDKKEYRRFKIKTAEGKPDDFKSMAEVIRRHFAHSGENTQQADRWDDPDLIIIDGGKGQLSAALSALTEQGVAEQPMISLAKKFEEVYLPGESRPVLLSRDSQALFLLQQIRDEAHRFAITYHRSLREKAGTQSVLDDIPGVGEKSRQKLLLTFGSVEKIREASLADLQRVINTKQAQAVVDYFQSLKP